MGYSVLSVEDIEGAGPGGAVRFVRRALGVEAFGINWFDLPPGAEGREHDESESGQEEVSVVVAGSGHWRVDGSEIPATVGTFIRFDAETSRCAVAGPNGMTFVSVGSRRGSYEPRGRSESRPRREVDVLGGHGSGGPARRRVVGPVEIRVRDDLVRRRRSPLRVVLGGVRVADQRRVVTPDERTVQRRTDTGVGLRANNDSRPTPRSARTFSSVVSSNESP